MSDQAPTTSPHETNLSQPTLARLRSIPRWAGIGLFIYATVHTLSYAKSFFVPVVLGFLLTLVFSPIRRFFDRRGVPAPLTSLLIVVVLLLTMISVMGALALPLTDWVERAPEITERIRTQLSDISGALRGVFDAVERLNSLGATSAVNDEVVVERGSYALDVAALIPGIMAQFIFTLILLFFLLSSGEMFYEKLVHVMPTFRDKRLAVKAAYDIERKLSHYLLTITIINACPGVPAGVAMWLMGMPSPFVFGMIAFVFNFVPYIGALAGAGIATAVALVSFDWIGWAAHRRRGLFRLYDH